MAIVAVRADTLQEERASQRFLEVLADALASGKAFLAERQTGDVEGTPEPGAVKLGWRDADGTYLLPDTSFSFARSLQEERGGLAISRRGLHVELRERGLLKQAPGDPHLAANIRCEGQQQRVL